jgi:hypothetical protein
MPGLGQEAAPGMTMRELSASVPSTVIPGLLDESEKKKGRARRRGPILAKPRVTDS